MGVGGSALDIKPLFAGGGPTHDEAKCAAFLEDGRGLCWDKFGTHGDALALSRPCCSKCAKARIQPIDGFNSFATGAVGKLARYTLRVKLFRLLVLSTSSSISIVV